MDFIRKLKLFIVALSFILPVYADEIDHYEDPVYEESVALMPRLPSLFQEIDADNNGFISLQELQYCSDVKRFDPVDILMIWSFRENFYYISSMSDDTNFPVLSDDGCFFIINGLSFQDVEMYIDSTVNDKIHNGLLPLHLDSFKHGYVRQGIQSIDYKKITQGGIGNCGLIASIASLAYSRREAIYEMINANDDGSFSVQLPGREVVKVTPEIETLSQGSLTYPEGLWLYIIELAVVKIKDLDRPGNTRKKAERQVEKSSLLGKFVQSDISSLPDFMCTDYWSHVPSQFNRKIYKMFRHLDSVDPESSILYLTGNHSSLWNLCLTKKDVVRNKLTELSRSKKIMVAGKTDVYVYDHNCKDTYTGQNKNAEELNSVAQCGWIECGSNNLIPPYQNLPHKHAYSILSYDEENDIVVLRNPWGNVEIQNILATLEPSDPETEQAIDGINDGIFEMELDAFMRVFDIFIFEL